MNILLEFILHPFTTIDSRRHESPAGLALLSMFVVWLTILAQAWGGGVVFFLWMTVLLTIIGLVGHLAYIGLMDWTMQLWINKSRFIYVAAWLGLCYLPFSLGISLALLGQSIPFINGLMALANLGLLIWSIVLAVRVIKTQYQISTRFSVLVLGLPILVATLTVMLMMFSVIISLFG